MAEEKVKKTSFFKRIYLAIKEFEHYGIFAAEKLATSIKYFLILMLIFVFVICGIFIYQFHTYWNAAISYFENNIEQIYFKEGNLEINNGKEIKIQNDNSVLSYIVIDTDATEEQIKGYEKTLSGYETGIIILNNKMIYKNEILSQSIEYKYTDIIADYPINEFDKQAVLDFISQLDIVTLYLSVFFAVFIYLYIIYTASAFVDIIMLAVLGYIISRIVGMKIRFKATFNIGVYALTLPLLLNLIYIVINSLTGFTIEYFSWMYITISYIYVIVAILMIKEDFINKQAELMKIIEEQEKVRQEIMLREEEKRREQEKNENKDNEDKKEEKPKEEKKKTNKKEKEDNKLGNDGLAPQQIKKEGI